MAEVRKEDRSLEGFLAWENRQPERWERVGEGVRCRDSATAGHVLVAIGVATALSPRLRGSPWRVHGSQLRIVTPAGDVL